MIKKLLGVIGKQKQSQEQVNFYRELIRQESHIGGQLFGRLPAGHTREFFCLDKNTWIWHEEWTDAAGQKQSKTTRYDVRPDGILKAQNNGTYHAVGNEEARNLISAAKLYHKHVMRDVYRVAA